MTNERTLEEAIALIRVLVAHSHEPLPRDLLEQASKFLEDFPYEPRASQLHDRDNRCVECHKYRNKGAMKCGYCGLDFSANRN